MGFVKLKFLQSFPHLLTVDIDVSEIEIDVIFRLNKIEQSSLGILRVTSSSSPFIVIMGNLVARSLIT